MYDVFAIAAYIINNSIDNDNPVTNLKLQKILFYVQAAFLVKVCEPCFEAEIQAWKHGPVVPTMYRDFRDYGADKIEDKIYSREEYVLRSFLDTGTNNDIKGETNIEASIYEGLMQTEAHVMIMNEVIQAALKYTPWELVDKTHEDLNWPTFYTGKDNQVIEIEEIKRHYEAHLTQLL